MYAHRVAFARERRDVHASCVFCHPPHRVLLTFFPAPKFAAGVYHARDFSVRACVTRVPPPPNQSFVYILPAQPRHQLAMRPTLRALPYAAEEAVVP